MKALNHIVKYISRKNLNNSIFELEGLRFFSILLVVLQHFSERVLRYGQYHFDESSVSHQFSYFLSRGTIGVYIFFAISGYVLTLPWIKDNSKLSSQYFTFIKRRFTRIEPPYFIWMTVFFLVLIFSTNIQNIELLKHYVCSLFYVHNVVYQTHSIINPVAWSLEVELQFYLLAPFLVKAIWLIKNINHRMLFIVGLIILIQFVQFTFGWWHFPNKITILGALPHFLIGILMVNVITLKGITFKKSYIFDVLFFTSWIALSYLWSTELVKNILFDLILAVLIFSAFHSILINSFLKFKWVIIIGGMCYSIYLIHLPLIELIFQKILVNYQFQNYTIHFLTGLGITLALASIVSILSFLFVEKPFMKYNESIVNDIVKKIKEMSFPFPNKKIIIPVLILVFTMSKTNAQEINTKSLQLLPIDQLIDSAITKSPTVFISNSKKEIIKQQLKIANKSWLNHISITGNSLYGTGSIIDNQFTSTSEIVRFQNSKSVNYNVGLSMRIPLSSFLNVHNEKNILKAQYNIIDYEKDAKTNELINEISKVYYSLLNNINQAEIASEKMEANRMKLDVSETFFKSGKIDIGIYKNDLENYYNSKANYSQIISSCNHELFMLKKLVGTEVTLK